MITEEQLKTRIDQLNQQKERLIAQANMVSGQIFECQTMLKEFTKQPEGDVRTILKK